MANILQQIFLCYWLQRLPARKSYRLCFVKKKKKCAALTYIWIGKFCPARGIYTDAVMSVLKQSSSQTSSYRVFKWQWCITQSHVSLSTTGVIEVVNWLKGKTGCGLSPPLILLQVCQSHAIKRIACIALLLISKWQRRQCVAMCTWGQGLIALFQFFLFPLSRSLSLSLSLIHPPFLSLLHTLPSL